MISTFNSTTTSSGEFTQENTADSFRRKVSIASAVSVAGLEALLEPFVSDVSDSEPTAGMVVESLQQEVLSLQLQLQKEKDEKSELEGQLKTARMALMNLAKASHPPHSADESPGSHHKGKRHTNKTYPPWQAHADRGRELEEAQAQAMRSVSPRPNRFAAGSALGEAEARDHQLLDDEVCSPASCWCVCFLQD